MINRIAVMEQWLTLGSFAFITSFIWSPSRDGLEASYALFFLFPLILLFLKKNSLHLIKEEGLILLILIFSFYSTITTLWNKPEDIFFFLLQFFILATWIIGTYWLVSTNKINIRKILLILIHLGSLTSLITVIVFYQSGYEGIYHFEVRLTCWCAAESANLVGALYGTLTVISYSFLLSSDTTKERIKFGITSAALMLPLIFSQSRGALFAFFIAVLGANLITKPKRWFIGLQFLIALPALALFIIINYSNLNALWIDRTASIGQRDLIWNFIYSQISQNFVAGIGMSQNTKIFIDGVVVHHAHNSWLDTLYRTGAIGLTLSLIITFFLLKKAVAIKTFEGKVLLIWLLFGLVTLTFDHRTLFWEIDAKWFFYWVPAALILGLHQSTKNSN